jgi:hypothetical protein
VVVLPALAFLYTLAQRRVLEPETRASGSTTEAPHTEP